LVGLSEEGSPLSETHLAEIPAYVKAEAKLKVNRLVASLGGQLPIWQMLKRAIPVLIRLGSVI
jgi:hypothetical protein